MAALRLARQWNPERRIILLTDDTERVLPVQNIQQSAIVDFCVQAKDFAQHYQHFSDQDLEFEVFCFERWLVLLEFMEHAGFSACVTLDSDCFLYSDLSQSLKPFEECDATLSFCNGHYCGHISSINEKAWLADFCSFLMNYFVNLREVLTREVEFDRLLNANGWKRYATPLNDMRLLGRFRETYNYIVGDTAVIQKGTAFDHGIGFEESGYQLEGAIKKLDWQGGEPYAWHTRQKRPIRMNALHLQGGNKKYAEQILQESFAENKL